MTATVPETEEVLNAEDQQAEDFGIRNRRLPKSLQQAICEVITEHQQEDRWIKLQERLQDALLRYYDVDVQHLWSNNNIWFAAVPGNSYPTGDGGTDYFPDYINDYPVFNAFAQIRQAKLSEPDIGIDFQPINPKRTADREAARAAEAIRLMSDMDQDPHETVARKVYFTDMGGRCITWKELCDDHSVFGTGPNGEPRRKIVWHIGGVLEWEVPLFSSCREKMLYAFHYSDPDIKAAKSDYPWIAPKLSSGQMCLQEGAYSRIARLGVIKAVQSRSYDWNIGDSLTHLVTQGDCWLRVKGATEKEDPNYGAFFNKEGAYQDDKGLTEPSDLDSTKVKSIREKIAEVFPDGVHAVIVGKQYAESWNECMDDVLSILHSQPGRGMTRRPGLKPLVAIQDRINQTINYISQSNDTGAPSIWLNSSVCDFNAATKQVARPWALRDLDELDPKIPIEQVVHREEQEDVPGGFLKFFEVLQSLAQFQVFCPPSIFGTGSSDNPTAEGMVLAAKQALGILGKFRTAVIQSMAEDYTQVALIVSRDEKFPAEMVVPRGPDAKRTSIVRKESLTRGNFRAFPDKDSGFPESTASKRQALERLIMLVGQTPLGAQVFGSPSNIAEIVRLQGANLTVPEAQAWDKQSREIEQLLRDRPQITDPQILAMLDEGASVTSIMRAIIQKAQQAVAAIAQAAEVQDAGAKIAAAEAGGNEPPKAAIAPPPPLTSDILATIAKSSVDVRVFDVNIFEAAACADWLSGDECYNEETIGNSETPDGAPVPNTAGVLNVTLHCFEHVIAKSIISPPMTGALPTQGSPPKLPPGPAAQ